MKKKLWKLMGKIYPTYIIKKSHFFNEEYYENRYNITKKKAAKHYLKIGYINNYNPSENFQTLKYKEKYPDACKINPLLHYELYGKFEGRSISYIEKETNKSIIKNEKSYKLDDITIKSMFDVFNVIGNVFGIINIDINKDNKYVAIFSHEMTRTGAPIALKEMIRVTIKRGYTPIIFTPKAGPLIEEMVNIGCAVIEYDKISQNNIFEHYLKLFKFVIINTCTVFTVDIIKKLNGKNIQVIWWIHEGYETFDTGMINLMPDYLFENIHIFCSGEYNTDIINKIKPSYNVKVLHYMIEDDMPKNYYKDNVLKYFNIQKNKVIFSIIGTLQTRKGQSIAIKTIENMDDELLKKCYFLFAGNPNKKCNIYNKLKDLEEKNPNSVKYLGELDREDIIKLYSITDYLICPSVDDVGPIVVTEAWQKRILTICSENCGQANIIKRENCGLLYKNNDYKELKQLIEKVMKNNICNIKQYTEKAFDIYKKEFSSEVFSKNVNEIINNIENHKDQEFDNFVSIVIPVYNGGEDLKKLLSILSKQENIKYEIICIDSGSEDDSVDTINKYNCRLIKIKNEEFTHSYSRNLGAQNANGDLLLFMTQDALPEGKMWLKNFVSMFNNSKVDAASIRMDYKEEHDVYGKFEMWHHINWVGFNRENQIVTFNYDDKDNFGEARRKASITDITCMCKKKVFDKYKYRGLYGEDLDFGIRILKDGYKIGFFKDISVKHSHNRKQYYFLKRGIIDYKFTSEFAKNNNYKIFEINIDNIENRILSLYLFSVIAYKYFDKSATGVYDCNSYIKFIDNYYKFIKEKIAKLEPEEKYLLFAEKPDFIEDEVYNLIFRIFREKQATYRYDDTYTYSVMGVLNTEIIAFFKNNYDFLEENTVRDIKNLILKKMSILIGTYIACVDIHDKKISKTIRDFKTNIIENSGV